MRSRNWTCVIRTIGVTWAKLRRLTTQIYLYMSFDLGFDLLKVVDNGTVDSFGEVRVLICDSVCLVPNTVQNVLQEG